MSKIHVVTLGRLNRALARVVGELEHHGFWTDRLAAVDVEVGTPGLSLRRAPAGGRGCVETAH